MGDPGVEETGRGRPEGPEGREGADGRRRAGSEARGTAEWAVQPGLQRKRFPRVPRRVPSVQGPPPAPALVGLVGLLARGPGRRRAASAVGPLRARATPRQLTERALDVEGRTWRGVVGAGSGC